MRYGDEFCEIFCIGKLKSSKVLELAENMEYLVVVERGYYECGNKKEKSFIRL